MRIVLLLPLLAACSAAAAPDSASSATDLSAADVRPVDGPALLRGTCTDGGDSEPFVVGLDGSPTNVFLRQAISPGVDFVAVQASATKGSDYTATLRSVTGQLWTGNTETALDVTKTSLHAGDTITLRDDTILHGKTIACTATLVPQPMIHFFGGTAPIALERLTAPRVSITIPLPNQFSCGVALKLAAPIPADAEKRVTLALRTTGTHATRVITTRDDDHTLAFRLPDARDWDVTLDLESRDHDTAIGDEVRAALGASGTLEMILCPQP
jgi:hypothetical protein